MEMEHESPILPPRNQEGHRQSRNSASILYRGNETTDLMGQQAAPQEAQPPLSGLPPNDTLLQQKQVLQNIYQQACIKLMFNQNMQK